jgi:ABC-type multidrug transport system fused ATPase/permease subunit
MAFFIYAKLALIILVICPLISFPIIKVGRVLRKLSRRGQEKMADINSLLYETIIGARIVKAFNMEEYDEVDKTDAHFEPGHGVFGMPGRGVRIFLGRQGGYSRQALFRYPGTFFGFFTLFDQAVQEAQRREFS